MKVLIFVITITVYSFCDDSVQTCNCCSVLSLGSRPPRTSVFDTWRSVVVDDSGKVDTFYLAQNERKVPDIKVGKKYVLQYKMESVEGIVDFYKFETVTIIPADKDSLLKLMMLDSSKIILSGTECER